MIQIANLLLTRRCNLKCSYCNLVKDYKDKPADYPSMKNFRENELTGEQWCDILQRLKAHNKDIFIILYGGEPFLYKDLDKILVYCYRERINYTIISNSTGGLVWNRVWNLYHQYGKYRGFTSSVDPIVMMPERKVPKKYKDIYRKSTEGLNKLIQAKISGLSDDVVAEITILKETIPYLYGTVAKLSEHGIYSSITAVDARKSPYYDFSSVDVKDGCLLEQTQELKELFARLYNDAMEGKLKIHIPQTLDVLYQYLPSNYKCQIHKNIHNVSIEPNGTFRLCLRIAGLETPAVDYRKAISTKGVISQELMKAIQWDYSELCKCCNWTCQMMSSLAPDKILNH